MAADGVGAVHNNNLAAAAAAEEDEENEDIEMRFQSFQFPTSPEGKDALLNDSEALKKACESYAQALGFDERVGVRSMGRVVAHIHSQCKLPMPSDDVLYSEIMERTTSRGTFSATYEEFVSFIEEVLSQCLQDMPLTKRRNSSAWSPGMDSAGASAAGLINLFIQRPNGQMMELEVDDSETVVEALAPRVEEDFGITPSCQQFINDSSIIIDPCRPLYEQGVSPGAILTCVQVVPQATLLRIRRCDLGKYRTRGVKESSCAGAGASLLEADKAARPKQELRLKLDPLPPTPSQRQRSFHKRGRRLVFCERRSSSVSGCAAATIIHR